MCRDPNSLRISGVVIDGPAIRAEGVVITAGWLVYIFRLRLEVGTHDTDRLLSLARLSAGDNRRTGAQGRRRYPAILADQRGIV